MTKTLRKGFKRGLLEVLGRVKKNREGQMRWRVRCECGTCIEVPERELTKPEVLATPYNISQGTKVMGATNCGKSECKKLFWSRGDVMVPGGLDRKEDYAFQSRRIKAAMAKDPKLATS